MKYLKTVNTNLICLITLLWLFNGCNVKNNSNLPQRYLQIQINGESSAEMKNIVSIFTTRLQERSGVSVEKDNKKAFKITLAVKPGIGKEGFMIEDGEAGNIKITGNDVSGLLYGIGKFLRTSSYSIEGFIPGKWRGKSVPDKPVRGIYFATHYYNYYQTAPVEDITRYVEDLALWGYNNLMVWYDMHHFKAFDDPVAVVFRERLAKIMRVAKNAGMGVSFIMIANEGYANSPVALRATPGGSRGGNYPEVICPNKAGGLEYILKTKREFFEWCRKVGPEYICIWPYDQGGCSSIDCQPWGSNGFLKCAEAVAGLAEERLPDAKVILSTWMFDSTEWSGLSKQHGREKKWADIVMAEKINDTYKGIFSDSLNNLPMVGFPEISMYNSFPWGGFGANPFPKNLFNQWQEVSSQLSGGFPYSEGIFDDINKIVYSQLYWNPAVEIDDILKEYIRYEFAVNDVDSILKVIHTLEQNHHMRWWPGELEGVKLQLDWFPSKNAQPQPDPGAEDAYEIMKKSVDSMPAWAKSSWRWRILFIRTMLDAELKANGGSPNEKCYEGFYELLKIYHCTEQTDPVVKPPLTAAENK